MFEHFKSSVFGEDPTHFPRPGASRAKPITLRIKELYRILVRRLHPDLRADGDTVVSALWHDVQEAYASGDAGRLEMLLAFTDIESNTAGTHTSLFQMRSVLRELRRTLSAVQKRVRAARQDPAWNFARKADRSEIHRRIRGELDESIAKNELRLSEMEAIIASWIASSDLLDGTAPSVPKYSGSGRRGTFHARPV